MKHCDDLLAWRSLSRCFRGAFETSARESPGRSGRLFSNPLRSICAQSPTASLDFLNPGSPRTGCRPWGGSNRHSRRTISGHCYRAFALVDVLVAAALRDGWIRRFPLISRAVDYSVKAFRESTKYQAIDCGANQAEWDQNKDDQESIHCLRPLQRSFELKAMYRMFPEIRSQSTGPRADQRFVRD